MEIVNNIRVLYKKVYWSKENCRENLLLICLNTEFEISRYIRDRFTTQHLY